MGLGFLAGFGLATLGLLAVAALIGLGAKIYSSHDNLTHREPWWYNEPLVLTLVFGAFAYIGAIVLLSIAA